MKKTLLAAVAALLVLACAAGCYIAAFPVKPDNSNLAEHVGKLLNLSARRAGFQWQYKIDLYDSVSIGKQKFTLVEIDRQLGLIALNRGVTGQYKIDSAGYGDGNFVEEVVAGGAHKYCLFGGRNTALLIDRVTFTLDGREYGIDVPQSERFLASVEVDPRTEDTHRDPGSLRFYNPDGADITELIRLH